MSVGSNQMDVCTTRLTKLESGRKPDRKMIKNTDAAMPLCNELEAWCKSQKLPYLRADDLAAQGYLTADQKVWIGDFQQRWEALKAGDATEQVSSRS